MQISSFVRGREERMEGRRKKKLAYRGLGFTKQGDIACYYNSCTTSLCYLFRASCSSFLENPAQGNCGRRLPPVLPRSPLAVRSTKGEKRKGGKEKKEGEIEREN